ncbi:MAG: hypothetical protein SO038_03535 [Campylobacter sp.]|nr:hypothetical protein [Campylobacter sp.]
MIFFDRVGILEFFNLEFLMIKSNSSTRVLVWIIALEVAQG